MHPLAIAILLPIFSPAYSAVDSQLRRARSSSAITAYRKDYDKLRAKRPPLSAKDRQLVGHGIRLFFLAYLKSNRQLSPCHRSWPTMWRIHLVDQILRRVLPPGVRRLLRHMPAVVPGSDRD
jgi:hypothetical protein